MECGIFALIGVILGALLKSGKSISFSLKKKKPVGEKEENEVMKQWENLLSYDGKTK